MQQRWQQHERQKSNWINKLYNTDHESRKNISLPSLHNYDMKMPNFTTFYKRHNQAISRFSFSFWTWIWFLGIHHLQESSPTFDNVMEMK